MHGSNPYDNPAVLLPVVVIFILVFCIVYRTMQDIPVLNSSPRFLMTFCVASLAVLGLDQALIRTVVQEYTAMGVTMLLVLSSVLLATWIKLLKKEKR